MASTRSEFYKQDIEQFEKKKEEDLAKAMGSSGQQQYAGMIDPMSAEQLRIAQEQQQLAAALRAQAEGKTPSLAEMQFRRGLESSQAAIQSQLASARGLSPGQAQRLAARQQAALGATGAGQAAEIRLREQMASQAALANLLAQSRQGALGGYSTAAELAQRERQLRAEIASGIQSRAQARQTAFTAGLLGALPFVGQGLSKAYEAYKTPTGMDPNQFYERPDVLSAFARLPASEPSNDGGFSGFSTEQQQAFDKLAHGAEIPGRARYDGDTRSNDTVPAMLSPGEIVLPRTVAQSPDAPDRAKQFVAAIKAKKKPSPRDFTQALMRIHELESRLDAMEALSDQKAEEA